jgi:dipeptidyl aminopeptidase/acylaminoacyl peptidase
VLPFRGRDGASDDLRQLELIPRDVLFGNPERTAPRISPDGSMVAYLAPHDGILAVWVQSTGGSDARVVASDPKRPISNAFWAPDGSRVLYLQDTGGDENYHLFGVSSSGGDVVDLTPFPGARATVCAIEYDRPDAILVTLNERDKRLFDVHRLDIASGKLTFDTENPGNVSSWTADADLAVRAAIVANGDASYAIIVRDTLDSPWRTLITTSADDGMPNPVAFTGDGTGLYVITALGANAARLMRYDLAAGTAAVVIEDPDYDVADVAVSAQTNDVIAVAISRDRLEWHIADEDYRADFAALRAANPGDFRITSSDRADTAWIAGFEQDDASPSFWAYDRRTKTATKLFDTRPALATYQLASMLPVRYAARDGLTIHGYLTLPRDAAQPAPMVLFVHGGPWARDTWGFRSYPQWLANRGYAVLQVNFRGSTGYGKTFLNAGDLQWAGTMHTDLLDAKRWAVERGYADPARVAIMGGSYGGYATLAALTLAPDAFAAGIDIVGPSNLNTLLASIPAYWATLRAEFTRRMGEDPTFLYEQSPLFKADRIRVPLLIGQGANDPRVNIRESDQIVAAMRQNGLPVTYVVFEDEGHGFARPDNNNRFNAAVEAFLATHLGGRAEAPSPNEDVTPFLR